MNLSQLKSNALKPGVIALMLLMAVTRVEHFGDAFSLPDASRAAFFLAGLWFGQLWFFVVLLIEAGLIDYIAIAHMGVSDFCISPAYVFLVPSYAAMWFGGRLFSTYPKLNVSDLTIKLMLVVSAITVSFIISNGSFYLLSDKYPDTNWVEYSSRFMKYYPSFLQTSTLYIVMIYAMQQMIKSVPMLKSGIHKA